MGYLRFEGGGETENLVNGLGMEGDEKEGANDDDKNDKEERKRPAQLPRKKEKYFASKGIVTPKSKKKIDLKWVGLSQSLTVGQEQRRLGVWTGAKEIDGNHGNRMGGHI